MRFYKKFLFVFICFFVVSLYFAFSQEVLDWYYYKPIKKIEFTGLNAVKKTDLKSVTKEFIGKGFTDDLYFELLNRLSALDYFDSIEPVVTPADANYESVIITFSVEEYPMIEKITFTGNRKIRRTELIDTITIKEKDIFSENKLAKEEQTIRDLYLKRGYTNIRVGSTYEYTDKGVQVFFQINEGYATKVKKIEFQGNQIFSSRTLKNTLSMKEASAFTKGAFQESMLEKDKQSLLQYYYNRGYVDATVVDIVQDEKIDNDGNTELYITFILDEGYQYTYAGLEFQGNWLFSSSFLESKVKLKVGDVFNAAKFQEGFSAISNVYYENGYISTMIQPMEAKDPERRQVSYMVIIQEGSRSHVENVIVQGNKKTKESVIRREIPFEEGDIFSNVKYVNAFRNLMNLRYFSSVIPELLPGSEEDLVNVVYTVEDQSTTSVEFGLTFAGLTDPNAFPVSLLAKWQDTNLAGTGQTISLETELSPDAQTLGFSYSNSWLFNKPINYSGSISGSRKKEKELQKVFTPTGIDTTNYYMDVQSWDITVSNSLGKRWYPGSVVLGLSGGLVTQFLRNQYDPHCIPVDTTIADYNSNWGLMNSVWTAFSADKRDLNYDPSKGWFASQQLSWIGLLPTFERQFYLKSDTVGEIYKTLVDEPMSDTWNLKIVFAGISKFSFVAPYKNRIGNSSLLSVDGMFSARGWDTAYANKGKVLWSNNLELRVPVVPNILSTDFFFDMAVVRPNLKSMFSTMSWKDVYFSFGPGVRSLMQQLPLRVMLANTFKIDNGGFRWGNADNKPDWKVVLSFNLVNN
ncbi:MAG: outer membrane protein assembly factor BamA [Spirochaetaceae bacterium]|nr:outer membrane protein assembly factor BamA [Spirochaetaceae bacterium]